MVRVTISIVIVIVYACLAGCGGSSGTNGATGLAVIYIQPDEVNPQNVTTAVNNQVKWINASNSPKQVISGTLGPSGSPLVERIITIGNTGFTPNALEANFGDTVKFNNLTLSTFNLDIVSSGGQLVTSVSLLPGQLSQNIEFPAAGKYTYRKQGNSLFNGNIILFGDPNPSGQFQSPVLSNGDTFTAQFDFPEFIPYFVLDVNNPSRSFITGSIRIQ